MRDWSRQQSLAQCDICAERTPDVLRFGLVRRVKNDGRPTSHGAGGIWLCESCWKGLVPMRARRRLRVAS